MKERRQAPEAPVGMRKEGREQAISGLPIPTESVVEMKRGDARKYLLGYMGFVEESLSGIGIIGPETLGVHESFQHIVVQDRTVECLAGVAGLNDGMRLREVDGSYELLEKTDLNHYRDGRKIGHAFSKANVKRGNFGAIPAVADITSEKAQKILPSIKEWLVSKSVGNFDPGIVLELHPLVRLAFAYCINNGNEGFEEYSEQLLEKVENNQKYSDEVKNAIADGIKRGPAFAAKLRSFS